LTKLTESLTALTKLTWNETPHELGHRRTIKI
jgi:hypothetical protein